MPSLPRLRVPLARGRIWFDPRFAVGLVLVVVSVLGVTLLVAAAERTRPVYAATRTLAAGETVDAKDLAIAQVRLGRAERRTEVTFLLVAAAALGLAGAVLLSRLWAPAFP